MNHVEAEGRSIDEAIERALHELGTERDRVEIEIVSNATPGLFGFGGRKAKVRATVRSPLNLESTTERAPAKDPGKPVLAPGATRTVPRPISEPGPESTASELDSRALAHARAIMQETVRLVGTEATVDIAQDPEGPRLVIGGDVSGLLIGRRGQTLDALEYFINRVAAREEDGVTRIAVDSENYRARRRQSLEALAQQLADRARRRGRTVTLNPMSPRDRRIVHLALQGDPTLTTRSSGKGYLRKLLIIPEADRRTTRQPRKDRAS